MAPPCSPAAAPQGRIRRRTTSRLRANSRFRSASRSRP